MKLALLGCDPDALALAKAAVAGGHRLVWACGAGVDRPAVAGLAPDVRIADHWEDLLGGAVADAVIVATPGLGDLTAERLPEDVRAEQLRLLAQEAVPMLVAQPAHPSMLIMYEVDMIRRETGCPLVPYFATRWSPAVEHLLRLRDGGELGTVEQVVFERSMPRRDRPRVETQFAVDVDLLRQICGDLTRLGAMGPGVKDPNLLRPQADDSAYASLGVQLSGPGGVLVRWSVGPVEDVACGKLSLMGSAAKATLLMPAASESWTVELRREGKSTRQEFSNAEAPARALQTLSHAMAGEPAVPDWVDAARSVELAESIHRSLAKGRVVELYNEDYTEQSTFKGTMTSLGCGLLLGGLGLMLVAAIAAQAKLKIAQFWPHLLLVLLVLFLGLQLLRLLFPADNK